MALQTLRPVCVKHPSCSFCFLEYPDILLIFLLSLSRLKETPVTCNSFSTTEPTVGAEEHGLTEARHEHRKQQTHPHQVSSQTWLPVLQIFYKHHIHQEQQFQCDLRWHQRPHHKNREKEEVITRGSTTTSGFQHIMQNIRHLKTKNKQTHQNKNKTTPIKA